MSNKDDDSDIRGFGGDAVQIAEIKLCNFQSFGPDPTVVDLANLTYVLGPNGSGKTAVLEALSRLFSPHQSQRKIRIDDFHIAQDADEADEVSEPVLWIEVRIELPEAADDELKASVPPSFSHMIINEFDSVPEIRMRLTATLAADGIIDEKCEYILEFDDQGEPTSTSDVSRYDRGHIEVHYLPARRDPAEHIAYTASSLIGRTLRATDWTAQRTELSEFSEQINQSLVGNAAIAGMGGEIGTEWTRLHKGVFFKDPTISFGQGELEDVLRLLTISFSPSHSGAQLPFERLSDGQKSLLYISLVMAWRLLARRVLAGEDLSIDPTKLRPPVHMVVALEEPENSLAPHYLGRIATQLNLAAEDGDFQALIATHTPTLLRRVHPESIRFLRLNPARETTVRKITLPENDGEANKYVREAVEAFPELYFARVVVLGEGDSEMLVVPRLLSAFGVQEDDASIAVVPLGGRHVNHFWRLLHALQIPHVTLLDLDCGRDQAGWGRVKNAMKQVNLYATGSFDPAMLGALPKWNDDVDFPTLKSEIAGTAPLVDLEEKGVFFSHPIDLDHMMLQSFPDQFEVIEQEPDEKAIAAVLGKAKVNVHRLDSEVLSLFDTYHEKFDLSSKPVSHLAALSQLTDDELLASAPDVLLRLIGRVKTLADGLQE